MMLPNMVVTKWAPEQSQQQHLTCCSGVHLVAFLQIKFQPLGTKISLSRPVGLLGRTSHFRCSPWGRGGVGGGVGGGTGYVPPSETPWIMVVFQYIKLSLQYLICLMSQSGSCSTLNSKVNKVINK